LPITKLSTQTLVYIRNQTFSPVYHRRLNNWYPETKTAENSKMPAL